MTLALEIRNLNKIYNKGTHKQQIALNDVSLNIKKGIIFGLLGPNGAGKSTLINTLGTVVIKTSGIIKIMGYDLEKYPQDAKKNIGIVTQEVNIDPFFTPLESLMLQQGLFGQTPNKKHCLGILNFMGLKGKESSYVRSLSGGMKRRVLIAKALVHAPKVVILDEPTAGVDVDLRKKIWDGMLQLNKQGTTIILTTHYLEEAQNLCEEIAIINKGFVVANDTTSNLINNLGNKKLIIEVNGKDIFLPNSLKSFLIKKDKNKLIFSYNNNNNSGFIINELNRSNISINNLIMEEAKLEDVFLKLTN